MKDRALLLALRIAAIQQEFSESEIQRAIRLLEEQGAGSWSSLLAHAAQNSKQSSRKPQRARKAKPIDEQRSKAVIELEKKDPEKYQVLSEFDLLLRKGSVLPAQDDVRKLGERLSKKYSSRNSRRESISKLMALLADRPLDEIRELLRVSLLSSRVDEADSDYQRLAQFIITGKISQPAREQGLSL